MSTNWRWQVADIHQPHSANLMETTKTQGQHNEGLRSLSALSLKSSKSSRRLTGRSSAGSSRRPSASTRASTVAELAQAKAQVAIARLVHAEKEKNIKIEEATLDVLQHQAAMAKAEVMEAAAQFDVVKQIWKLDYLPVQATTEQKVSTSINITTLSLHISRNKWNLYRHSHLNKNQTNMTTYHQIMVNQHCKTIQFNKVFPSAHTHTTTQPQPQQRFNPIHTATDNVTSDLAKFLARSQLVTGGQIEFDDKPENYLSWKAIFKSTCLLSG